MAERHIQILSNLIKAVSNIADRGSNTASSASESIGNVDDTMRRLFPSIDVTAQPTDMGRTGAQGVTNETHVDRSHVGTIPRFNPNNNYRPKSGKRAKSSSSKVPQKRAKVGEERTTVKAVILLPRPKTSVVPKGAAREELFERGFATTFELSPSMSQKEIRGILEKFQQKLDSIPPPKFEFVRAVSNKIFPPQLTDGESFGGRLVKHYSKQGPVYIRAMKDLNFPLRFWSIKTEDNESSDSDESVKEIPTTTKENNVMDVASAHHGIQKTNEPENMITLQNDNIPSTSSSIINLQPSNTVACPTCSCYFPLVNIAEHADACADARWGSTEENKYNNIMNSLEVDPFDNFDDETGREDEIYNHDLGAEHHTDSNTDNQVLTPENHKAKIMAAVKMMSDRINTERSRVHVRRKTVFDDYIGTRQRSKWMDPENQLKVTFVGEPALDGGGPKREFFTDVLKQIQMRLFDKDGMAVQSTVALTFDHFKYAGELMAMSIVQGGPEPNFLSPCLYDVMSKGLVSVKLNADMIKDLEMKDVACKIAEAQTEEELHTVLIADATLSVLSLVGYRGIPSQETLSSKDVLVRSIAVKAIIEPKLGMIHQLEDGLSTHGLLQEVKKMPDLFEPLFVTSNLFTLTSEDFLDNLLVRYSEKQGERNNEENTFKHFCDFTEFLYHTGSDECNLSLCDLVKFITGSFNLPPLGFGDSIIVSFLHGCQTGCKCRATSSTCMLKICLPVHATSFDLMKEMMISAMLEGFGFGGA